MQLNPKLRWSRSPAAIAAFAAATTGVCTLVGLQYLSIGREPTAVRVSAPRLEAISSGISAPRFAAQDDSLRRLRQANPSAERAVVALPAAAPALSPAPLIPQPKRKAKKKQRRSKAKRGSSHEKTPSDLNRNLLSGPANHFRLKTTFALNPIREGSSIPDKLATRIPMPPSIEKQGTPAATPPAAPLSAPADIVVQSTPASQQTSADEVGFTDGFVRVRGDQVSPIGRGAPDFTVDAHLQAQVSKNSPVSALPVVDPMRWFALISLVSGILWVGWIRLAGIWSASRVAPGAFAILAAPFLLFLSLDRSGKGKPSPGQPFVDRRLSDALNSGGEPATGAGLSRYRATESRQLGFSASARSEIVSVYNDADVQWPKMESPPPAVMPLAARPAPSAEASVERPRLSRTRTDPLEKARKGIGMGLKIIGDSEIAGKSAATSKAFATMAHPQAPADGHAGSPGIGRISSGFGGLRSKPGVHRRFSSRPHRGDSASPTGDSTSAAGAFGTNAQVLPRNLDDSIDNPQRTRFRTLRGR